MTTLRKVIATLVMLVLVPLLWWQTTLYAARSVLAAPDLSARVLQAPGLRTQVEERLAQRLAERLAQVEGLGSVRFTAAELRALATQVVAVSRLEVVVDAHLQLAAGASRAGLDLRLPVREITPVLTLSGAQAALSAGLRPLLAERLGTAQADQSLAGLDLGPVGVDAVAPDADLKLRAAAAGAQLRAALTPTVVLWWVVAGLLGMLVLLNLDRQHTPFTWAGTALLLGGAVPLLGAGALQRRLAAGAGPAARLVLEAVAAAIRGIALWVMLAGVLSLLAALALRYWRRRAAAGRSPEAGGRPPAW